MAAEINEEAKGNFEREMRKLKDFFHQHGVYAVIYTDSDLANPSKVFDRIAKYLAPKQVAHQLEIHVRDALHRFKV